jgi:hypothetical protein
MGPDALRSARRCRAIFGVDAVDPAEHVRVQELVVAGEMPVERSTQLILLLLTWTGGVALSYGFTADQGRTEEKIPPLCCGAQHEH